MQVMVKNKKKGMCSDIVILPQDMQDPGYRYESSKQGLATIAQYVSAPEWAQLAQGTNAAIEKHHYQNKCCVMTAFKLTLGLCFCPLVSLRGLPATREGEQRCGRLARRAAAGGAGFRAAVVQQDQARRWRDAVHAAGAARGRPGAGRGAGGSGRARDGADDARGKEHAARVKSKDVDLKENRNRDVDSTAVSGA